MFKPDYSSSVEGLFFCCIKDKYELFLEIRDANDPYKVLLTVPCEFKIVESEGDGYPTIKPVVQGGPKVLKLSDINPHVDTQPLVFTFRVQQKGVKNPKPYICNLDYKTPFTTQLNMPFLLDKDRKLVLS